MVGMNLAQAKMSSVVQGEPLVVAVPSSTQISNAYIENKPLHFGRFKNSLIAPYAVDLYDHTGTTTVKIALKNGKIIKGYFYVLPRLKYEAPLGVPEKLGGNSAENQKRIVSVLETENKEIAKIVSKFDKPLWRNRFSYPLNPTLTKPIFITDPYGYDRKTGTNTIIHKGTDFRAATGTPVFAINKGVVRLAKEFTVYGNTIIVDHGLGVMSLYMHLSSINVVSGQIVERGMLIAHSGDTGYAEAPHLHLSVKIGGVSIDPVSFMGLF